MIYSTSINTPAVCDSGEFTCVNSRNIIKETEASQPSATQSSSPALNGRDIVTSVNHLDESSCSLSIGSPQTRSWDLQQTSVGIIQEEAAEESNEQDSHSLANHATKCLLLDSMSSYNAGCASGVSLPSIDSLKKPGDVSSNSISVNNSNSLRFRSTNRILASKDGERLKSNKSNLIYQEDGERVQRCISKINENCKKSDQKISIKGSLIQQRRLRLKESNVEHQPTHTGRNKVNNYSKNRLRQKLNHIYGKRQANFVNIDQFKCLRKLDCNDNCKLSLKKKDAIQKLLLDKPRISAGVTKVRKISKISLFKKLKKDQAKPTGTAFKCRFLEMCKKETKICPKNVEANHEIKLDEGPKHHSVDNASSDLATGIDILKSKARYRKDLTLEEKVQAIGALGIPGAKLATIAKKFGVSVSAISRINKNKEFILSQSGSGDLNTCQKRSRECKDPILDKCLLKWHRALERVYSGGTPFTVSNILLKEKAIEFATYLGKDYFPSDNWISRWKNRHNIGVKANNMAVVITKRDELKDLDSQINLSEILEEIGSHIIKMTDVKQEKGHKLDNSNEEIIICEHCGIRTNSKKKKDSNHLSGCPASAFRKDLTLEEKVQVVRALELPGVKMVNLAKKYGVSSSAISRIHKNRIDILARRASGLGNSSRRRERSSKEPEVEKALCDWFKVQHDLGIHISSSMIREKARDIANVMGKDFQPSESWVFRWRHRNNVMNVSSFSNGHDDEVGCLQTDAGVVENCDVNNCLNTSIQKCSGSIEDNLLVAGIQTDSSKPEDACSQDLPSSVHNKKLLSHSVMCEKCGFVSLRFKNNRIKSLRHAKGCPDLKPRNELTYESRASMLKALEQPGATLSSVARQFGVSVSSMSRMNQKKDQILSHSEGHATQKRLRDCKEPEVAHLLYQWYLEKKMEGIHVTGTKLKDKAAEIAAEKGRHFTASCGWLGRWRHRYGVFSNFKDLNKSAKTSCKKKVAKKEDINRDSSDRPASTCIDSISEKVNQTSLGLEENHFDSVPLPVSQHNHEAPIFLQRLHNPWEIASQQIDPCVWSKEFFSPSASCMLDEATAVSVAYAHGENFSKQSVYNMFDTFSPSGCQVVVPVDSSVVMGREYNKHDVPGNLKHGSPHLTHLSHHPSSNLSIQHHHNHSSAAHPHSHIHLQQAQVQLRHPPVVNQPPPPASPAVPDDDPEQQRRVLEAFKIMSSFVQKKSLGEQVQAALKTIEMSVKNYAKSSSTRDSHSSV